MAVKVPSGVARWASAIEAAATEFRSPKLVGYGIDLAALLTAIMMRESGGNPAARGPATPPEIGLMQLWPKGAIAAWEGAGNPPLDYADPESNVRVAAWFIGQHIRWQLERARYPVTVRNILAAYNGGLGGVRAPKPVTLQYVEIVGKSYEALVSLSRSESTHQGGAPARVEAVPAADTASVRKGAAVSGAVMLLLGLLHSLGVRIPLLP